MGNNKDKWITTKQASELIGCSLRTVQRYVTKGDLEGKRIRGIDMILQSDAVSRAQIYKENLRQQKAEPTKKKSPEIVTLPAKRQINNLSLDANGEALLQETISVLESNNLLKMVPKSVVANYVRHRMLLDKHIKETADAFDDPFLLKLHTDIASKLQKTVQHYETQLGLTPAALMKIKPPEEEISVDPLEELLNG